MLGEIHQMRKDLRYVLRTPRRWEGGLRRSALARNIQGSNTIEGYIVAKDEAAAIDNEEPFSADHKTFLEIQGYRQSLGYVLAMSDADYASFDTSELRSDPIVRSAMAHLNLVMIHPFRDGNGRMARALATLVLSRSDIGEPEFSSIEEWLGANTEDYYSVLAHTGHGSWKPRGDGHLWLAFILRAHHMQAQTLARNNYV